jgi:hypothetical protein
VVDWLARDLVGTQTLSNDFLGGLHFTNNVALTRPRRSIPWGGTIHTGTITQTAGRR